MKKLKLNVIFCMSALLLGLTFIFISEPYACDFGADIRTVKEKGSEEAILELVDFLGLNYEHEFEVVPELDGIDFFASSLNKDVCQHGFNIYLDEKNNLTIKHASDRDSCNELIKKIVEDFQQHKNLPKNRHIEQICYADL